MSIIMMTNMMIMMMMMTMVNIFSTHMIQVQSFQLLRSQELTRALTQKSLPDHRSTGWYFQRSHATFVKMKTIFYLLLQHQFLWWSVKVESQILWSTVKAVVKTKMMFCP